MRLDARDKFPSGMEEYFAHTGWHFSKKMFEWVASNMYKKDANGRRIKIQSFSKEEVDELLKKYGIVLENKFGYDYVFAANMCKADYLGSSIPVLIFLTKSLKIVVFPHPGFETIKVFAISSPCIMNFKILFDTSFFSLAILKFKLEI